MRVALLCSGPSLGSTWHGPVKSDAPAYYRRGFDVVIAVNRAAWAVTCDWCAFVDTAILEHAAPKLGFITHRNHPLGGRQRHPLPWYEFEAAIPSALRMEQCSNVCAYTTPSALIVAGHFAGPNGEIEIHGMDCSPVPEKDCGGWTQPGSHGPSRWRRELPWLRGARAAISQVPVSYVGRAHQTVIDYIEGKVSMDAILAHYQEPVAS